MTKKHKQGHDEFAEPETAAENPQSDTPQEQVVEDLYTQVEQLQAEVSALTDKMLRYKAEADNAVRRSKIDLENAHKYGMEKFARELLDVVDSLERGLEVHQESEHQQFEDMKEGMQLTYKQLLDVLKKFGISQIDPQGADFDPKKHEALTTQMTTEVAPNKVLTVVQKGFEIYDRILRPARVVVAKGE